MKIRLTIDIEENTFVSNFLEGLTKDQRESVIVEAVAFYLGGMKNTTLSMLEKENVRLLPDDDRPSSPSDKNNDPNAKNNEMDLKFETEKRYKRQKKKRKKRRVRLKNGDGRRRKT